VYRLFFHEDTKGNGRRTEKINHMMHRNIRAIKLVGFVALVVGADERCKHRSDRKLRAKENINDLSCPTGRQGLL
jgi:hypothetical protein